MFVQVQHTKMPIALKRGFRCLYIVLFIYVSYYFPHCVRGAERRLASPSTRTGLHESVSSIWKV